MSSRAIYSFIDKCHTNSSVLFWSNLANAPYPYEVQRVLVDYGIPYAQRRTSTHLQMIWILLEQKVEAGQNLDQLK